MAREHDRTVRLFVDVDGRLTDLLYRLNIETSKVTLIPDSDAGRPRGFGFVEISRSAAGKAIRALQGQPSATEEAGQRRPHFTGPSQRRTKGSKAGSAKLVAASKRGNKVRPSLLAHAIETFGSEETARDWLSSECGALNNRTPLEVIQAEGNVAEVERILDCIDYGMLA